MILAVVIMLLLLFLGTIFLKTVLANLGHAEESVAAANEYSAAEQGIRFADTNLTTSEYGADWRPRASYTPTVVRTDDPDYYWIQPFNSQGDNDPSNDVGGYVRYNLGDSRFLLRVTYNPSNLTTAPVMPDVKKDATSGLWLVNQPSELSRFVMIEAVGRRGSAAEIDKEYEDLKNGDPIDPTVFTASGAEASARFRRELVAFKAIGINSYLRFVTDRDRLARTTYFGVDQMFIRDGNLAAPAEVDYPFRLGIDPAAFTNAAGVAGWATATGSPLRVNGNLVWYGSDTGGDLPEITLNLLDPRDRPWNRVEVAGKIGREGRNQGTADAARMAVRLYDPAQCGPGEVPLNNTSQLPLPTSDDAAAFAAVLDSSKTPALTVAECIRDNAWLTADPLVKQGIDPRRSVQRLEPPRIETTDPGTGMLRYQAMTYGAPAVTGTTAGADLSWQARLGARYGYGAGIYIDNARHSSDHSSCRGDIQFNHSAEKLRDDWVRPYSDTSQGTGSGWKHPGRVYEPVGVLITLEPDVIRPGGQPVDRGNDATGQPIRAGLMSITRADYRGWRSPRGDRLPVQTMYFEIQSGAISSGVREYTLLPKYWDGAAWQTWDWTNRTWVAYTGDETNLGNGTRYPFNGVLFAEGNVRIRGRLPKDTAEGGMRLTVVSRGTAYIEGNLLKGDPAPGMGTQSFLALLARDYVCLNTTQFIQVQTDFVPPTEGSIPPFFWRLPNNRQDLEFYAAWDFGVPPNDQWVQAYYAGDDTTAEDNRPALFLRHQADRDPVTMQWHLNGHPYQHRLTEHGYDSATLQDFYPLFHTGEWEFLRDFARVVPMPFPVYPDPRDAANRPIANDKPGKRNIVRIDNYDPGQAPDTTATTGGDYNLGALAVQPLDIWITALVYAEHNSWFVIPGTYFQDTAGGDPEPALASRYPRNGEPLDVQVHVWGAISEGQAASLEDVTQWTAHWRGANRTAFEAAGDPAASVDLTFSQRGGINYAFDPKLITDTRWVRQAQGEPAHQLPGLPRLPMCPDLVYFGERPVR